VKVCLIHNFYQQPGGEDNVFRNEGSLLASHNHQIQEFTRHNNEILHYKGFQRITLAGKTTYNYQVKKAFRQFVKEFGPDVLHFHNTFPLISPAVYGVGKELNIPVVQTIHNYRFFCANGLFYREGKVCEDCFEKSFPWPAVAHACYRDFRLQSLTVAAMQAFHQHRNTWQKEIDAVITLTGFGKQKLLQAGFPAEKVHVKPNFVPVDPGYNGNKNNYGIFVGRLTPEKGVQTLLEAWRYLDKVPLKIVGDGPMEERLKQYAIEHSLKSVEFLGRLAREEGISLMKKARFLLFPSEWYETFGLVAAEAFACGTPVIASRLGAMGEIVKDGYSGLHFTPGNAEDLAAKVQWAREHLEEMQAMGKNARREYEEKYTAERNYEMLMGIYEKALEVKRKIEAGSRNPDKFIGM